MCDELRLWNFCFHLSLCSCINSPWVQSQLIPWCQVATWRLCLLPLTLNRPWTSDCPWQLPVQMADYIKVISGPQRCLSCFWVWLGFVSLFLFLSLFKKKKNYFGCAGCFLLCVGFLQLQWLPLLQSTCSGHTSFSSCGCADLVAPWHVESSRTRDWTHVPCHWQMDS